MKLYKFENAHEILKKRTKNTCTISALYMYFESHNDKFCLIDSANCACSDQPAQNHGLAEVLVQVVMALSRTNPPDFGLGKNIVVFFLTVHFKALSAAYGRLPCSLPQNVRKSC